MIKEGNEVGWGVGGWGGWGLKTCCDLDGIHTAVTCCFGEHMAQEMETLTRESGA